MKKYIFLLLLATILSNVTIAQIDTSQFVYRRNSTDGKYGGVLNKAGGISAYFQYILNNNIDTSLYSLVKNQTDGKYDKVTNKIIIDGKPINTISANLIYLLNSNIATTDASHTFTATQYFNKIFVDTLIANNIDSVHSTYWYSDSGDTIGYINAATEKVAFFKKMTIGDLQTNTTVAENFIRSNQVQTDTIYPHSPLFLAGDTTIAKKIFARSIIIDSSIVPAVNHKLNIGKLDSRVGKIYSDTVITNIINGYDKYTFFESSPFLLSGRLVFVYNSISTRVESYGLGQQGRGVTIIEGFGTYGQTDYQNFFVMNRTNDAVYNYNGIRIGYSADSVGYIESVNKGQYSKRPLVIKSDTVYNSILRFNTATAPASPKTGDMYYDGTHFLGYNGTIWKQLDN